MKKKKGGVTGAHTFIEFLSFLVTQKGVNVSIHMSFRATCYSVYGRLVALRCYDGGKKGKQEGTARA